MDGDPSIEDDERSIELSSIQAIFPELEINPQDPFSATLQLPVSPAKPLRVVFPLLTSTTESHLATALDGLAIDNEPPTVPVSIKQATAPLAEIRELSHLPPLQIRLVLPVGYPEEIAPKVSLSSDSSWLPEDKLRELERRVDMLWEELRYCNIIYDYIDLLQQEADFAFNLAPTDGTPLSLPSNLEIALLDYDLNAKRQKFEESTFSCGVCLEPKKGIACHRLRSCGHVFCIECLQSFYNNCITEGDVYSVKCLAPDCEKKSTGHMGETTTLEASELLQIPIEQDQVQRYVKLLRKKALESNKNTIYCPRKWCQGPAKSTGKAVLDPDDPKAELPPPADRLAICLDCSFAFCHICTQSWHGTHTPCNPRSRHELSAEETATEKYLNQHSQLCPTCRARCQKTMGCNHMECFQCKTHFCYLCRAFLDRENPYKHFNSIYLPCYMKLWVMEEGDGEPGTLAEGWGLRVPGPHDEDADDEEDDDEGEVVPPPAPIPPAVVQRFIPQQRVGGGRRPRAPRPAVNAGAIVFADGAGDRVGAGAQNGLQRFLAMAAADQEDEWDSDEFDELDGI